MSTQLNVNEQVLTPKNNFPASHRTNKNLRLPQHTHDLTRSVLPSNTLNTRSSPTAKIQFSHSYKATGAITFYLMQIADLMCTWRIPSAAGASRESYHVHGHHRRAPGILRTTNLRLSPYMPTVQNFDGTCTGVNSWQKRSVTAELFTVRLLAASKCFVYLPTVTVIPAVQTLNRRKIR